MGDPLGAATSSLAVDIGGTKIAAARVTGSGSIDGDVLVERTPAHEGPDAVLAVVADLLARLGTSGALHVGVSAAGVIDVDSGSVVSSTDSMHRWAGTDLAGALGAMTDVPAFVLGDGHAFALGECSYGLARDVDAMILLAVGTGIGGSFVSHQQPLMGSHWTAGQFGHLPAPGAEGEPCYCGASGHLEAIASGAGVLRWYHHQGGDPQVRSAQELVARSGDDPLANRALEQAGAALGAAAAGLCSAFDPGVVVVAGGLTRSGEVWERSLRQSFDETLMPALRHIPLRISMPDSWLALRGAARYAHLRTVNR